jgi:cytochrome c oxidase cbb3-type subunit 2
MQSGEERAMKNGPLLFLGLFAALGFAWAGIVLGANAQLSALAPYYDTGDSQAYPLGMPGVAARGQLVYRDLDCAACHTQAVRRPGFGADQERGWGERQSVARDYIYQPAVQLGQFRIGPDLANLGGRKPSAPDASDLYQLLYTGRGGMPGYQFLFEDRKILGQTSDLALALTGRFRAAPGHEIVPTRRAQALVAYLLSLNSEYVYPEARPAPPPAAEKPVEVKK